MQEYTYSLQKITLTQGIQLNFFLKVHFTHTQSPFLLERSSTYMCNPSQTSVWTYLRAILQFAPWHWVSTQSELAGVVLINF